VGLNNYTIIAPEYDRTPEAISLDFPHPVHNVYLLFTAELGVVGGLFFLWLVIVVSLTGFKVAELHRSEGDTAIGYGLGAGLMCCWLQGLSGWGHWSSIVHLSLLAMIAGVFGAYTCMVKIETEDKE
jgi:O-antigen ligase